MYNTEGDCPATPWRAAPLSVPMDFEWAKVNFPEPAYHPAKNPQIPLKPEHLMMVSQLADYSLPSQKMYVKNLPLCLYCFVLPRAVPRPCVGISDVVSCSHLQQPCDLSSLPALINQVGILGPRDGLEPKHGAGIFP